MCGNNVLSGSKFAEIMHKDMEPREMLMTCEVKDQGGSCGKNA